MNEPVTKVNCFDLWEISNIYYPKLLEIYRDSAESFGDLPTDSETYFAFKRSSVSEKDSGEVCTPEQAEAGGLDYGGSTDLVDGGPGPVFAKYVQLREEISSILGNTVKNIEDTAKAVNEAAWAYSESDDLNADDLRNLIDNSYDDVDYNEPNR